AVGDGANDGAMVQAAGMGVAYRAKPVLAEIADGRIVSGDLRSLLFFQGYRAEDIVEPV
ncbi:MAG: phosphoserine phosphatase SerB, partial [Caulobacterales bacterium]|nr:phosphoserine phosphatase SerB [Caulobacterales bacterium]